MARSLCGVGSVRCRPAYLSMFATAVEHPMFETSWSFCVQETLNPNYLHWTCVSSSGVAEPSPALRGGASCVSNTQHWQVLKSVTHMCTLSLASCKHFNILSQPTHSAEVVWADTKIQLQQHNSVLECLILYLIGSWCGRKNSTPAMRVSLQMVQNGLCTIRTSSSSVRNHQESSACLLMCWWSSLQSFKF